MSDNPLLDALPPATDPLTYLTILEYNLTRDQLPTLHQVLQNPELTSNIGWDLVHLLLPLLPAAEQCLQDVARLGNPREVVLKVTESLRAIEADDDEGNLNDEEAGRGRHVEGDDEEQQSRIGGAHNKGKGSEHGAEEAPSRTDGETVAETQSTRAVRQFNILLFMLSTLHLRIKTKYPSRFLTTSLKAVLKAYEPLAWSAEATISVLQLIKSLSGQGRPDLPPRASSDIRTVTSQASAPDPEAQSDEHPAEEKKLQRRLLQSFLTHVLENHLSCMSSAEDVPGLAWTSRLQEKVHPEKAIPGRKGYAERFAESEELHARDDRIGQMIVRIYISQSDNLLTQQALAQNLELDWPELLLTIKKPAHDSELLNIEDTVPSTASDIPLSRVGALYLLVARKASGRLVINPTCIPIISIFPEHALIARNYLGSNNLADIGSEPEATIDAVLYLGLVTYDEGHIGRPPNPEDCYEYLQRLSLLSANTPSPTLRYHAHVLTSLVLDWHPSNLVRLTFIRDTLEHCPYENLKASAVGWLKYEILTAQNPEHDPTEESAVSAMRVAIDTTAPYLFPDLSQMLQTALDAEARTALKLNFSFYLATLNFYYLLLSSAQIRGAIDVVGLHKKHDVSRRFLAPLRGVSDPNSALISTDDTRGGGSYSDDIEDVSDMCILADALERVSAALKSLGVE